MGPTVHPKEGGWEEDRNRQEKKVPPENVVTCPTTTEEVTPATMREPTIGALPPPAKRQDAFRAAGADNTPVIKVGPFVRGPAMTPPDRPPLGIRSPIYMCDNTLIVTQAR
jgi:hypothetical protein